VTKGFILKSRIEKHRSKPMLSNYQSLDLSCAYNKRIFFLYKERYVFQKKSIYYNNLFHIQVFFLHFPIMNRPIFNFWNTTNMHKGYAYQIFNYCYFKTLQEYNLVTTKNKNNMSLNPRVRTWKQNANKTRQRVQKVSQQKSMIKSEFKKVKF
jgi:hypothetical protein